MKESLDRDSLSLHLPPVDLRLCSFSVNGSCTLANSAEVAGDVQVHNYMIGQIKAIKYNSQTRSHFHAYSSKFFKYMYGFFSILNILFHFDETWSFKCKICIFWWCPKCFSNYYFGVTSYNNFPTCRYQNIIQWKYMIKCYTFRSDKQSKNTSLSQAITMFWFCPSGFSKMLLFLKIKKEK